jgi:cyclophilin family peptidyl-prolyl cis-trans isomerase
MRRQLMMLATLAAATTALSAQSAQVDVSKAAQLRNPAALKEQAPATYKADFDTNKGKFTITVTRAWAPIAADRFYNLVKNGYYDETRFFRVLPNFMAQIGIHGNPTIDRLWMNARIQDDPVKQSNKRGFVSFASGGANTRTTQFFISFKDNSFLDKPGACGPNCAFPPFGEVTSGMDVVDKLYDGYGEGAPSGKGPSQARMHDEGNAYLSKEFPRLDFVKTATIAK